MIFDSMSRYPKVHPGDLVLSHQPCTNSYTLMATKTTINFDVGSTETIALVKTDNCRYCPRALTSPHVGCSLLRRSVRQ